MSGRETGKWVQEDSGKWHWQPANGSWLSFSPDEMHRWGRGPLTDPDHPPTQEDKSPANTTAKPTPHGGYWQLQGRPKRWEWINSARPATVLTYGGYSYEQYTDPKHDPDGHPNVSYNQPKFPDGTDNPHYVAPDVNAPALGLKDGWPPDLKGDVPPRPEGASSPASGTAPPSHPAWRVDGGSLRAGEQDIVSAASDATHQYTDLTNYVASTKGWIFSAGSPSTLEVQSGHTPVHYDPNAGTTNELTSASDNLLLNVADAIHSAGAYTEALNAAGQLYSRADLDSFVPEN